jgi:D-arabinitol 4-dehydrogenase
MVASVAPYEDAKIRLLNASHSAIAWAGLLSGTQYIHEGARDPRIRVLVHAYATEAVIPCLQPSPLDLPAYRDAVLERFGNAALADTHQRVVADSYAKLREFVVPTIRECLARGASIASVAPLPALFLCFLEQWHRNALSFEHRDASLDADTARRLCADADPVHALVADAGLWGELAGDERLLRAIRDARMHLAGVFAEAGA